MNKRPQNRATVRHPAPHRNHVSLWIVLVGLVLAPAAWFLQLNSSYLLGTVGCSDGVPPATPFAHVTIVAAGLFAAVLALSALASAVRAWTLTRSEGPGDQHSALTAGHGRTRFLALAGFIVSSIFLVAVSFSLFVPLLVHACHA